MTKKLGNGLKKDENSVKKDESNFKKAVNELLGTPEPEKIYVKPETPSERKTAYIPGDMVITGNVSAASDLKVAGKIIGDVTCEGNVDLMGIIQGNVNVANLKMEQGVLEGEVVVGGNISIEESSVLKGNLTAKNVVSNGKIEGQIIASESVELKNNAYVKGDVAAKAFSVASGAYINGRVCINE